MRRDDFTKTTKIKALNNAENKCKRCWSEIDLMVHHVVPVVDDGPSDFSNSVVLCKSCHKKAPHDPFLFENLFLRFASSKEMIQHYKVNSETEAIEEWRSETGYTKDFNFRTHAELVKEKMREKVRNGGYPGFGHPYGYDYMDGELLVNDDEAKVVKDIFKLYLAGKSITKIVRMLNYRRIPTKRGKMWYNKTVSNILRNPLYCGYISWCDIVEKAEHEALIDAETYNRVQKMLSKRSKSPSLLLS